MFTSLRHLLAGAGVLAVVVDEVLEGPPAGLAREPLARVLHRVVEDRGTVGDVGAGRVLGHLEGGDLAAAIGGAGDPLGDEPGVVGDQSLVLLGVLLLVVVGHRVVLGPHVVGGVVGAVGGVDGLGGVRRLEVGQALGAELRELAPLADHVDRPPVEVASLGHVEPCCASACRFVGGGLDAVGVEAVGGGGRGWNRDRCDAHQEDETRKAHGTPLRRWSNGDAVAPQ